jgi:hypothetical protein
VRQTRRGLAGVGRPYGGWAVWRPGRPGTRQLGIGLASRVRQTRRGLAGVGRPYPSQSHPEGPSNPVYSIYRDKGEAWILF